MSFKTRRCRNAKKQKYHDPFEENIIILSVPKKCRVKLVAVEMQKNKSISTNGWWVKFNFAEQYFAYVHMYLAVISRFVRETADREKLSSNGAS